MKVSSFAPMIIAFGLLCLVLLIPTTLLEKAIPQFMVARAATGFSPNMIKGKLIQDKMLKNPKYLPIYGSSELKRMDPFHPSNYFKENPIGFTPFLVGQGGCQDLVHFLNFATKKKELENKKIVFILSPQWFTPHGIHFKYDFSILQAYEYALHPTLSPKLQAIGAKRLLHFNEVTRDFVLKSLLERYVYKDQKHQIIAGLVKPLGYIILSALEKRDFLFTLIQDWTHKPQPNDKLTKNVSWKQLRENAVKYAEKHTTNNKFGIDNADFNRKIKKNLKRFKGYRKDLSYAKSPEYGDLQLVLDVLKEEHVKALFISVPVSGYWYDYADISKKGREIYYKKVKAQIEKAGFQVADYSNHEYDKNFLQDTLHVGYEGWAHIDQAIYEFWKNKPLTKQAGG